MESSGRTWKDYGVTLELYNAVIISDYAIGAYRHAKIYIQKVLDNAESLDDKLQAHIYEMLCEINPTSNYTVGLSGGIKILNLYGFDVPKKISKTYLMKEELKLKMAMKHRSYSCLIKLPVAKDMPIFHLLMEVQRYALFTSNDKLLKVISWKALQLTIKNGMGKHLPVIVGILAASLAKQGKVKTAQELGKVAIALCDKVPEDKRNCAVTRFIAYATVGPQLQPFHITIEPLLQVHKDLKLLGGKTDHMIGSMLAYFNSYIAAGLELNPIMESKLIILEKLCRIHNNSGMLTSFQIMRQFILNLRTRTENPTNFEGSMRTGAFDEEQAFRSMDDKGRKMALRDSSSLRLQLAFVFGDEDAMAQLLDRLNLIDYPISADSLVSRLHNRLCFTGLAAFTLSQRKGCGQFLKQGQACLSYFEHLTKQGSVNAKPVYLFMRAIKSPSSKSFLKAIDTCTEANMIQLEAMARERYATFLIKESEDIGLAIEHMTYSYWLYQDWGAYAKALQMSQQYDILKQSSKPAEDSTISTSSSAIPLYTTNTTLDTRQRKFIR